MQNKRLSLLQQKNPHLQINDSSTDCFSQYGQIITDIELTSFIKCLADTKNPDTGVEYKASLVQLESQPAAAAIQSAWFGELPIQIGWCRGYNTCLGALEYHKSSELIIAVTDCLLLLGKREQVKNNHYQTGQVEAFYLPQNSMVELYATTLHFAPLAVDGNGFITLIILPQGTNQPLDRAVDRHSSQEKRLLFMKNKWLLAFAGSKQALNGAYPGLMGENIVIQPLP